MHFDQYNSKYFTKTVPRLHGVGAGEDAGSGIQRSNDARLGDRHRLLLHRLVQDRAGLVRHLYNNEDEKGGKVLSK